MEQQNKEKKVELLLSVNEEALSDKATIDKQNNLIILKDGNTPMRFTAAYEDPEIAKAKVDEEDLRLQRNKLAEELTADKPGVDEAERSMMSTYEVANKKNTAANIARYNERRQQYLRKASAYKKKYATYTSADSKYELAKARTERLEKAQQETLGKVKWLWHLAPKTLSFTEGDSRSDLKRQGNIQDFVFGKIYEGGGMGWVEAFPENDVPKNKIPHGFLVAAKGTPKIIFTRWREFSQNNDGALIDRQEKKFREAVQLHIYTQALYGQDLDIELYDNNWTDASLPPYELSDKDREQLNKDKKTPKALAKYFRREVKTYPLLDDEQQFIKEIISNYGETQGTSPSNGYLVQKSVVNIYLDELWRFEAGDTLRVHARISCRPENIAEKYAEESEHIWISEIAATANPLMNSNTIVQVGDIDTNAGNFRPCKYTGIVVKAGSADPQTIFSENIQSVDFNPRRQFNIVAGSDKAKQTIKMDLEEVETKDDDCTATPKHKGHVINVAPMAAQQGFTPSQAGTSVVRPAAKKPSLALKASFNFLGYGTKVNNDAGKSATHIIDISDESLTFDAEYQYNITQNGKYDLKKLWGYVWLPSVQVDTYALTVQTCRWHHDIDFTVYPDIKWTVGFKIDFDGAKFKGFEEKFKQNNGRTTLNPFKRAQRYTEEMNSRFARGDYSRENLSAYRRQSQRLNARAQNSSQGIQRVNPDAAQPSRAFDRIREVLDKYEVSLKAEWNNGADKVDAIDTIFETIENTVLVFRTAFKFMQDVLDGAHTVPVRVSQDKQSKITRLLNSFTKKPVDYSISAPSLSVAAAWYYETMPPVDQSSQTWGAGITWALQLSMAPLIGIEVKMDLFQMLSRKHPLAMAIYAASSLLQSLLDQDKPILAVNLVVKGEINLEGKFKHNTVGGNVMTRGGKSDVKEEILKGGAVVTVTLEVRMHGELQVDFFYVSKIKAYIDAGIKGSIGFGLETAVGSDEMGMYWENVLKFEGLKLKGNFTVDVEVTRSDSKRKRKPEPLFDGNFEIGIDEASWSMGQVRF